jgi:CheY-like chemotaxis protein
MEPERKALIVDDDVAIRVLLSRILRTDFEVEVARDGAEAIEKISAEDYSIILLDLMMPRIDGVAVVRYLTSYRPEVLKRVIVLTAWGAAACDKVCPPVARFLEKPFTVDDLMREVAACCQ